MTAELTRFQGLRNTSPPKRQPFGSLMIADNVVMDDSATLETRPGYALSLGLTGVTDAYQHKSLRYGLVVANGSLIAIDMTLGQRVLATGLVDGTYVWTQVEERVFYAGKTEAGMVVDGRYHNPLRFPVTPTPSVTVTGGNLPDAAYLFAQVYRHVASGMEGPSSPPIQVSGTGFMIQSSVPAGYEADVYASLPNDTTLRYLITLPDGGTVLYRDDLILGGGLEEAQINGYPLPESPTALAIHEACLHVGVWDQASNTSLVYVSRPHFYTVFTVDEDGYPFTGKVLGLHSTKQGLVVGTDVGIWLLGQDDNPARLADYGVVAGKPIYQDQEGNLAIWTTRGLATWTPNGFSNLYGDKLSVAPGSFCATIIIDIGGTKSALVLTDTSGAPFNAY